MDLSMLTVISGPCVIESEEHALKAAETLKRMFERLDIPLIYKSSYDKANRSSSTSYRGPGLDAGLRILEKIKRDYNLRLLTDVHTPDEARAAADVCDVIQIPAFLCRQTDLLVAAAGTKAVVNVKKGQFLAPWDMSNVIAKLEEAGKKDIILTDRGTVFGYNNLVSDMRGIPIMKQLGYPVCFDASHSVQLPGGLGTVSGGQSEFIGTLAKAAVAAGADMLFIESHPHPQQAKCDQASQLSFKALEQLLPVVKALHEVVC